jgi:hypothetical protein
MTPSDLEKLSSWLRCYPVTGREDERKSLTGIVEAELLKVQRSERIRAGLSLDGHVQVPEWMQSQSQPTSVSHLPSNDPARRVSAFLEALSFDYPTVEYQKAVFAFEAMQRDRAALKESLRWAMSQANDFIETGGEILCVQCNNTCKVGDEFEHAPLCPVRLAMALIEGQRAEYSPPDHECPRCHSLFNIHKPGCIRREAPALPSET